MIRPLTRLGLASCLWMGLFATAWGGEEPGGLQPESATHYQDVIRPVLVKFCGDCHSATGKQDAVRFMAATSAGDVAKSRGMWHSVAEQLRNRTMPPPDQPQPDEAERLAIATWIEQTLRATACEGGEFAGVVLPRRLNRYEYERTILDLLGVEYKASESFPVDGSSGEGFNNNGEALYLPPLLMERYLAAAGEILDRAILSPPVSQTIPAGELQPPVEGAPSERRTLSPGEEATAFVTIYVAGNYTAIISARSGTESASTAALKVDGLSAENWTLPPGTDATPEHLHQTTIHLTRGVHALAIHNAGSHPLEVTSLKVASPDRTPDGAQRERHRRLLLLEPGMAPSEPRESARAAITQFARRAYRRPVEEAEVDRLLTLYNRAADRGDPWEESVKLALKGVLVSPGFLFRIEADPSESGRVPVPDHELAVRLSYFLWSSPPDEELSRLADAGRLQEDAVLRRQVDRLLSDPRAEAFAHQFVGQWLGTHEVGARVAPSTSTFEKQFTSELLLDLRDEPAHFFAYLLKEDRSLLDLLDSDYTVINDRLSRHYGYKPYQTGRDDTIRTRLGQGGVFARVSLPDDRRGGVLGMGGVHLLTSYPDRTSPVLRGGWVLETLLGIHVPPPPPDVPVLKRSKTAKNSLRDQLAQHRENPACAACHNLMDPLGFALENFDVLGRWRDQDGSVAIDATATLPSGEEFAGPAGLRTVLLERKPDFLRQLTRKMLGYALGRSLEDADDCTVQKLTTEVEAAGYSTRTLVHAVVQSTPFRYKQLTAERSESPSGSRKSGFVEAQLRDREKRDRKEK